MGTHEPSRPAGRERAVGRGEASELAIQTLGDAPGIRITSSAFGAFDSIPRRYTKDGENISPPLFWDRPVSAVSFALLCEDPDAPTPRPFVHWIVYGLATGTNELLAGVVEETRDFLQGVNSYGHRYYDGPAPPPGDDAHEYHFQLFALDCVLAFEGAPDRDALVEGMDGHVIAAGEVVGTYGR
jgi:Raf kinase inhibitor-like YbhB/YbcL family protein